MNFLDVIQKTKGTEFWRYTNLTSFAEKNWQNNLDSTDLFEKAKAALPGDFYNLVFLNGKMNIDLSSIPNVGGIKIDFKNKEPQAFKKNWQSFEAKNTDILKPAITSEERAFENWNASLEDTSLAIEIAADFKLAKPLAVHFWNSEGNLSSPKIHLTAGKSSELIFLEVFHGQSKGMTNSVTHISLAENSQTTYVRTCEGEATSLQMGSTHIYLARDARLQSLSQLSGGEWSRHFLSVIHEGQGSKSEVNGIFLADQDQKIESYTNIDHVVGHCESTQTYKGILQGKSRAVFNGRVHIRKGAEKANSAQLNNNLVLSDQAEIDTKPQLEIWADDVKATHGSTVGQLNAEEIFYLQSRALDVVTARKMLAEAFVIELVERISHSGVSTYLLKNLRAELGKMRLS